MLPEDNCITIYAEDDVRSEHQPTGKQSHDLQPAGCFYTRTTGILQTVWLEAVENAHIKNYKIYPNISEPSVAIDVITSPASVGATLYVTASYNGKTVGNTVSKICSLSTRVTVPLEEKHLWEPGRGRLYDLHFQLEQNGHTDILIGYFGLREVSLTKEHGS